MGIEVLGIDLGKTVCSLAGLDATGAVVYRKRLQRHRLLDFLEGLDPCIVAMEACGGAHHIGRFCLQHGHEPRLMSSLYVRPYVKLCSPQHNLTYHQMPIMRRNVLRPAYCRGFGPKFLRIILECIEPGEQARIPLP